MSEEIKVVVRQENQGTALKDAARDTEQLQAAEERTVPTARQRAAAEREVAEAKRQTAAAESRTRSAAANGNTPSRQAPVITDYATQTPSTAAAAETRAATVDYAALQRQNDQAAQFMENEQRRIDSARQAGKDPGKSEAAVAREQANLMKQIQLTTELEAKQLRAAGDTAGAEKLEREAAILGRTLQIQQSLKVSTEEATVLATQQVDAEAKLAAQKQAAAEAERKKKEAAAQTREETRKQLAEERARAREEARRGALEKADLTRANQTGRMLLHAGTAVTGMGGPGGLIGALGSFARGPAGMAALLAATAGLDLLDDEFKRMDKAAARGGREQLQSNKNRRIAGMVGVEGEEEAASNMLALKEELKELRDKQGTHRPEGWMDRMKLFSNNTFGTWFKTSDMKAEAELQKDIKSLEAQFGNAKALAEQKFNEGTAGKELEITRRTLRGDRRGARELEEQIILEKEYQRLMKLTQSEEISREGAALKVADRRRQQAGSFAGLVNARSGTRDIAAAAAAAAYSSVGPAGLGGVEGLKRTLESMHQTMNRSHQEAMNARPMRDFL